MSSHVPVLLEEVVEQLAIVSNGLYVDCTFGRGGHCRAILHRLGAKGRVFAMDRDRDAVQVGNVLAASDSRFVIEHESFAHLRNFLERHGVFGTVDGILLDLGVSSPQLDDARRGFSFQLDGPLDMRMDTAAPRNSCGLAERQRRRTRSTKVLLALRGRTLGATHCPGNL